MEKLVTKFSNGKYRNEGELVAGSITKENVKLMGEMIALQTLRTLKKYDRELSRNWKQSSPKRKARYKVPMRLYGA